MLRSIGRSTLFFAAFLTARAQERQMSGKVTYLSVGTIYTSIGSKSGAQDSTALYVVAGKDTVANLKVVAVSSKSSACIIVSQQRDIVVGDEVVGSIVKKSIRASPVVEGNDATLQTESIRGSQPLSSLFKPVPKPLMDVQGRVSFQYYSTMFDNSSFNYRQPGVVVNLQARSHDVPLKLDVYGNLRTFARGGVNPFSSAATDASRIYRFSLEYDDKTNNISIGRIIPFYAPSVGSIDGLSFSHRFGKVLSGASVGFQPTYNLQGLSTDARKFAVFTQYHTGGTFDLTLTGAYARTYFQSLLDREVVSFMVNAYTSGGFSVYGYSDIDVRTKQGGQFNVSPSLSMASFNANYRFTDFLSVGIGADASRAVFPFSTVRFVADSLLDRTLRSGATFTISVSLMDGVGVFNTYSPRVTDGGFGNDYLNSSAFFLSNAFSTGATVRATYTMNENEFTSSRGYGLNLERNVLGVDLTLRYQQNQYRVLQINQDNKGETFGADIMALFSKHLSFVTSLDSMRGFGSNSYSIFSELSWRF
jgi:hypothetical protein